MILLEIVGFFAFCFFNFLACYIAYFVVIDELTLRQIYELKIKTRIPFLLSEKERVLLNAIKIVTEFKTYFKTDKAKSIHATIIDILSYYESKKADIPEISHFVRLKIEPLEKIVENYKKDNISMNNAIELMNDIDLSLIKYKSNIDDKSQRINTIELKVLKSFYN